MTKQGDVIISANYSKAYLKQLRTTSIFRCLQCHEQVILRVGTINIPHFAHKYDSECSQAFTERESTDHLTGKIHLYTFFQQKKIPATLEAFLPKLKQRPDILVQGYHALIAVEFQCSQMDVTIMSERNNGYKSHQIMPLWILRTPPISELPTREIGIMRLSTFKQQFFIGYPKFGKMIITYCPKTKQFHYITNTLHIRSNTFIIKRKSLPIAKQTWPFALVKLISYEEFQQYLHIYKEQRLKHLDNLYFHNKKGIQSSFLRICYKWQVYPKQLPQFIGVPSAHAKVFQVHAVEWQIQFIDHLLVLQIPIDQAEHKHCESFLRDRPIGPIEASGKLQAVQSYLQLLQACILTSETSIYRSEFDIFKMNRILYSDFLAN